ncbi:MAG: UDP-N-acetylmuramoyl-L-alanyl-D-glutamate--2,6-diaminopimelate ligase [Patescibacteria group bacterium]
MEKILRTGEKLIPRRLYNFFQPIYHWKLALLGALIYRFPSKKIKVIGVTGTKGKSSTVEIINAILEEAGYKTALTNTIRFKIDDNSDRNMYKMSMPGRFFMQSFIRRAVQAQCEYAVLEMTSQGAFFYRDRFIDLDAFVFTNLSPEHIEAHGSYENYINEKVGIARRLGKSSKKDRTLVVNGDDKESGRFLQAKADRKITYKLKDAEPYEIKKEGIDFTWSGKRIHSPLSGLFNLYNILAAITVAKSQNVSDEVIVRAIEKFKDIPGRVQKIEAGQDFEVIVDYAHTTDSMEKLFQTFPNSRKICVFGSTGGGRDTWKRPEMGSVADKYCDEIILTDDDSYDEDPHKIVQEIAKGITENKPTLLVDRREAIKKALRCAKSGDVVLLIGKGTDPYLMGPNGKKTPWSDAEIAREELQKIRKL